MGANKQQRSTLEEVVVTAQWREQLLQDVPISISVLNGEDLDSATVEDLTDVLSRVPGVSINETIAGGGSQVVVRGVAAPLAVFNGASPTAYYLDWVPFGFSTHAIGPDPNVYDLERIEVLRGPQGTLYGASALNGVVRVLTRDADLKQFAAKARVSTSNTEDGGWNYRGDVALNAPLIEGKLAARAVLGYQDLAGWIDKPTHDDANDAQLRNARLKINAQPTEELSIGASAWLSRSDRGAPSISYESRTSSSLGDEPISTDYDAYGFKVGYEFGMFSLTSVTSYIDYVNHSFLDLGIPVDPPFRIEYDLQAESVAQEVILSSKLNGPWRWSAGVIYRELDDRQYYFINGIYLAPGRLTNTSRSKAVFGEVTRALHDGDVEITAGLRYFEDNVRLEEQSRLTGVPPEELVNSEDSFDATTPRLAFTWHPSKQMTVYASYSEGFRSGVIQDPGILAVAPVPSAKPDRLSNYEIGTKGNLLGGLFSFDAAAYYIDWQDVQQPIVVRVPVGTTFRDLSALVNGESASGIGFDIGLTTRPFDGFDVGVNATWNDLTMDSEMVSGGVALFDKGDRLTYSPEYTLGLSADYAFPLGRNSFEGIVSASANYTSAVESRGIVGGVRTVTPSDSMTMARVSFSINAPNDWTVTLFVDNLTDENGSPAKLDNYSNWGIRVRPRTVGAQLEYRF
ncbi:TonB-dependent receptor [Steroidobacter flavus]|uniref:TonB-dependent receptor n=1 Tax=Steroidobacter flavus TaxID=1842136 RepID=A0ABV8SWQ3_9GAMM